MMHKSLDQQPLVSFILLSYNHAAYIKDALKSAFAQDYSNIEYILSDDGSTDNTYQIIANYDRSRPDRVIDVSTPENKGFIQSLNTCMKYAAGEIIVIAGGDDISLPSRVSRSVEILNSATQLMQVTFNDMVIDENGNERKKLFKNDPSEMISLKRFLIDDRISTSGASRAIKRSVYDSFGPLDEKCQTEDSTYTFRSLLKGNIYLSDEVGVLYRRHDKNMSSVTGMKKFDINAIINQYKKDLLRAEAQNQISQTEYIQLLDWIDNVRSLRLLLQKNNLIEQFKFLISEKLLLNGKFTKYCRRRYLR